MTDASPYLDFDRDTWRALRKSMPQVLTATEVEKLRGIGDRIDLTEVAEVYLPLSRLIHMQVEARQKLTAATEAFLGNPPTHVPFVIGVAKLRRGGQVNDRALAPSSSTALGYPPEGRPRHH